MLETSGIIAERGSSLKLRIGGVVLDPLIGSNWLVLGNELRVFVQILCCQRRVLRLCHDLLSVLLDCTDAFMSFRIDLTCWYSQSRIKLPNTRLNISVQSFLGCNSLHLRQIPLSATRWCHMNSRTVDPPIRITFRLLSWTSYSPSSFAGWAAAAKVIRRVESTAQLVGGWLESRRYARRRRPGVA